MQTRWHSPTKCCPPVISDARDSWYFFFRAAVACAVLFCAVSCSFVPHLRGPRAARQLLMNTGTRAIPMAAPPDPVEMKRIAIRVALISLALLGTLAWNGFLIFMVGRMID